MERIGNVIREKRKSLGLSMEKVARKADVTYKTVLAIEHGSHVTTSCLFPVIKALGLVIDLKDKEE
jgi:transcriptional regulator with XRE-family HTH domain